MFRSQLLGTSRSNCSTNTNSVELACFDNLTPEGGGATKNEVLPGQPAPCRRPYDRSPGTAPLAPSFPAGSMFAALALRALRGRARRTERVAHCPYRGRTRPRRCAIRPQHRPRRSSSSPMEPGSRDPRRTLRHRRGYLLDSPLREATRNVVGPVLLSLHHRLRLWSVGVGG